MRHDPFVLRIDAARCRRIGDFGANGSTRCGRGQAHRRDQSGTVDGDRCHAHGCEADSDGTDWRAPGNPRSSRACHHSRPFLPTRTSEISNTSRLRGRVNRHVSAAGRIRLEKDGVKFCRQVLPLSPPGEDVHRGIEMRKHEVASPAWSQIDQRHPLIADGLRQLLVERSRLIILLVEVGGRNGNSSSSHCWSYVPAYDSAAPNAGRSVRTTSGDNRPSGRVTRTALFLVFGKRRAVDPFGSEMLVKATTARICHECSVLGRIGVTCRRSLRTRDRR